MNFSLNFQEMQEIDITPNGLTRTWVRLAAGMSVADPSNNENVDQSTYLDGDGYGSSDVIGAQMTIGFSGHRVVGDPAQDYIANLRLTLGDGRKTNYRFTDAGGSKITGPCTIANVKIGGGDAGAKTEMSFEIHLNGKPTTTAQTVAPELTVVIAGGTASGTTTATATTGVDNTLGYLLTAVTGGTIYADQYISGLETYTSGADIIATAGQFLQLFEVSVNNRVVKFIETELASGDITA